MRRSRYILCLLGSALLLYYALPRFSLFAEGSERIFIVSWLALALFVIAGNLTALLYEPKRYINSDQKNQSRKKARYFG